MIVIYGTKAVKGKFIQTSTQCPFCGENHAVGVYPYFKYWHIYYLPIIPYGKEYATICEKCNKEVPEHYLGNEGISKDIKKQAKRPLWAHIGLIILLALIAWIFYTSTLSK